MKAFFLVIDTATQETTVTILQAHCVLSQQRSVSMRRVDNLLELIDAALKEAGGKLSLLRAIIVRRGVGSYTGLRVGVTVANTLAWSLDIPVIGIVSRSRQPVSLTILMRRFNLIFQNIYNKNKYRAPVVPIYGTWSLPRASAKFRLKK